MILLQCQLEINCNVDAEVIATACMYDGFYFSGKATTVEESYKSCFLVNREFDLLSDLPRLFNARSKKHMDLLDAAIKREGLQDRISKSFWSRIGERARLDFFWTVVPRSREHDVKTSARDEDYSRLMLHPLEQLAEIAV